ncbi:hypothetical protein EVAR_71071_1 [Eumeta japonica]|uniref:Uncharacterized protein n=1 Tax=Eumeta variegata TaxID=151549 RepID=A0A4C1STB6_EUMVA|nr:hypothetical protein EVAR_71071_1 [Eumeta japonica]
MKRLTDIGGARGVCKSLWSLTTPLENCNPARTPLDSPRERGGRGGAGGERGRLNIGNYPNKGRQGANPLMSDICQDIALVNPQPRPAGARRRIFTIIIFRWIVEDRRIGRAPERETAAARRVGRRTDRHSVRVELDASLRGSDRVTHGIKCSVSDVVLTWVATRSTASDQTSGLRSRCGMKDFSGDYASIKGSFIQCPRPTMFKFGGQTKTDESIMIWALAIEDVTLEAPPFHFCPTRKFHRL